MSPFVTDGRLWLVGLLPVVPVAGRALVGVEFTRPTGTRTRRRVPREYLPSLDWDGIVLLPWLLGPVLVRVSVFRVPAGVAVEVE